jgi:putative membrane protein
MEFEKVEIPKKLKNRLSEEDLSEPSTQLATYRTRIATYRTDMSKARSHMANERTHLAYFRTSMSLMTFGITINRFSIFIRENNKNLAVNLFYQGEIVGLSMVILGMALLCTSLYRFRRINKEIESNTFVQPKFFITILSIVIIVISSLSAAWMILSRI